MSRRVASLYRLVSGGCCIALFVACSSNDHGDLFDNDTASATGTLIGSTTVGDIGSTGLVGGTGGVTSTSAGTSSASAAGGTGIGAGAATTSGVGAGSVGSGGVGGSVVGGGTNAGGSGGDAGSGTGGSGGMGTGGTGGSSGSAGWGGEAGAGGQSGCDVQFVPRASTVFILLDRSSSMDDEGFWSPVKDGVLGTVSLLEDRVRFGLATFTGQESLTCPLEMDATPSVDLYHADEVLAVLDPLVPPDPQLVKGETPTPAAVAAVRKVLASDRPPGETFILLITDGDPDFCDDEDPDCAGDALLYELQQAKHEGITTLVFNIDGGAASLPRLEAFARAGSGLSVAGHPATLYADCEDESAWLDRLSALGRGSGEALAEYVASAPAGGYVTLDPTDAPGLEAKLVSETANLLSCHFDLSEGAVAVGRAEQIEVRLGDQMLALDDPDGWRLAESTVLEITGAACASYRSGAAPELSIGFDCSVLEP